MNGKRQENCRPAGICTCGVPDCWPLTARVSLAEDAVSWSGFRNCHRAEGRTHVWDYSALGPFVFDRKRYEAAVRDVFSRIEAGQLREQATIQKLEADFLARQGGKT